MGPATEGLHRVTWDLRRPAPDPVDLRTPGFSPPWAGSPRGPLAPPGDYTVEMALITEGGVEQVGDAQAFTVKPVPNADAGTDSWPRWPSPRRPPTCSAAHGAPPPRGRARDRLRHMRAAV